MKSINKRGGFDIAQKSIWWPMFMFMLVALIIAFVVVIGFYKNSALKLPEELRPQLIANRFVSSADCFAYVDSKTGRVDSTILDFSKFTDEQFKKCYSTNGQDEWNFNLKIKVNDRIEKSIKSNNFYDNSERFTLWRNVNVKDGNKIYYGRVLKIFVGKI